jgi:hypothetical protein
MTKIILAIIAGMIFDVVDFLVQIDYAESNIK